MRATTTGALVELAVLLDELLERLVLGELVRRQRVLRILEGSLLGHTVGSSFGLDLLRFACKPGACRVRV